MFSPAQEIVIDRYKRPRWAGSLAGLHLAADSSNPSCGDEVHVEVALVDGKIGEIRHRCRACAICTASADLLAEQLVGQTPAAIRRLGAGEVEELVGLPLSPLRLKCALLPLQTVVLALEQAEV